MNSFGKKLVDLRRESGMSQEALADKLGVSRQSISKWEIGMAIPRSSKINKICKVFDISADELFGNNREDTSTAVNENNNEENPVASDKKKINLKMMLKRIAMILIILLFIHLIYAVYKFCVLSYVTNKVSQYKNLVNYYCHIRTYETDDVYESTEVWYKDQKYKIKTTHYEKEITNENLVFLDCNKEIKILKDKDNNKVFNLEDKYELELYMNGNFLYANMPKMVKNKTFNNVISSLSVKNIYSKTNNDIIIYKIGKSVVNFDKNYLPVSYIINQDLKGNNSYKIKYFNIILSNVNDSDLEI